MAVSGLYPYRRVPKWEVGPGRAIMAPRACPWGPPHRRQDAGRFRPIGHPLAGRCRV